MSDPAHASTPTNQAVLLMECGGWRERQALHAVGESLRRRGVPVTYWATPTEDNAMPENTDELWRLVRTSRVVVVGPGGTLSLSAAIAAFRHAIGGDPPIVVAQVDRQGNFPQQARDARAVLYGVTGAQVELHLLEFAVLRTLRPADDETILERGTIAPPRPALPRPVALEPIVVNPSDRPVRAGAMFPGLIEAQRSFIGGTAAEIDAAIAVISRAVGAGGAGRVPLPDDAKDRLFNSAVAWLPEARVAELSEATWSFLAGIMAPAPRLAVLVGRGGAMLQRYLANPDHARQSGEAIAKFQDPTERQARASRLYEDLTGARGAEVVGRSSQSPITSPDLGLLWSGDVVLEDPLQGDIFAPSLCRASFWLSAAAHRPLPVVVDHVAQQLWGRVWSTPAARLALRQVVSLHLPETEDDVLRWCRVLTRSKSNRLRVSLALGMLEWPVIPAAIGEAIGAIGPALLGPTVSAALPEILRTRAAEGARPAAPATPPQQAGGLGR